MGLILPYFKPFTLRGFFRLHKKFGQLGKILWIYFFMLPKIFGHSGEFLRNVLQNDWIFLRGSLGMLPYNFCIYYICWIISFIFAQNFWELKKFLGEIFSRMLQKSLGGFENFRLLPRKMNKSWKICIFCPKNFGHSGKILVRVKFYAVWRVPLLYPQ